MTRFARLFAALDQTTSTNAKIAAMREYFASATPADAAWAVFFLTGRRFTRLLSARAIGRWVAAASGLSDWLLAECHAHVGDAAETLALLVDGAPAPGEGDGVSLAAWVEERLLPLRQLPAEAQQARVLGWLRELSGWERFTLLKILTGELRLGVSHSLVIRALVAFTTLPDAIIATRLAGDWSPSATWFAALCSPDGVVADPSQPYPFCLAPPLDATVNDAAALAETLGDVNAWIIEWKWDGIRAQVIRRAGRTWIWSRGNELITDRFPELAEWAARLPDGTVLDGEVLAFEADQPLPFTALQTRIGRQRGVERHRRETPVVFMAFDLLEADGDDWRERPLQERRQRLAETLERARLHAPSAAELTTTDRVLSRRPQHLLLPFDEAATPPGREVAPAPFRLSPTLTVERGWDAVCDERLASREHGVEGVMLKRRASVYATGRRRGDWWKWKIDPHTMDAVLVYAQPGSGQRASRLSDYTFAVWDGDELVPVAKAYSGLTDDEIAELDRWLRRHTVERFGPVRHVEPVQVFELGFEAIAQSSRHRSGIAVRFPRILRWRRDKVATQADTLDMLRSRLTRDGS